MDKAYAVIMAGGKGERFWPLSTSKTPKQVLDLIGDKSMLAMAIERIEDLIPPERVLVITSADLVEATCAAAPELPRENVIGEPFGRDTAAVCALASAIVRKRTGGGAFCILTADHVIKELDTFRNVLRQGFTLAMEEDVLITIGITPTFPSTGYGYIEHDSEAFKVLDGVDFRRAKRFMEKPDLDTATRCLEAGTFAWNSGMFIWSVKTLQAELRTHEPPLGALIDAMEPVVDTPEFNAALDAEYGKLEKISIDYALMEKAANIVMAKGTFLWDDVGSWPAVANHFPHDDADNVLVGNCQTLDADGNLVVSRDRLTALIGVKDLVVVQAAGATLVCPKDRAQEVKAMVKQLHETGTYEDLL
jgi:mannose-1-phosphate guanylyltransferase